MKTERRITVDDAVANLTYLFDTIEADVPTNQNRSELIRLAIFDMTALVTGLDPNYDYPLDDLVQIVTTFRGDVVSALKEAGMNFYLSVLNNGMLLAEVTHPGIGKCLNCAVTVPYNPELIGNYFMSRRPILDTTIH